MTKAKELREYSDEQLLHEMETCRKELFRLRFQATTERLQTPSKLRELRREIARIKTILRERELARGRQQSD